MCQFTGILVSGSCSLSQNFPPRLVRDLSDGISGQASEGVPCLSLFLRHGRRGGGNIGLPTCLKPLKHITELTVLWGI